MTNIIAMSDNPYLQARLPELERHEQFYSEELVSHWQEKNLPTLSDMSRSFFNASAEDIFAQLSVALPAEQSFAMNIVADRYNIFKPVSIRRLSFESYDESCDMTQVIGPRMFLMPGQHKILRTGFHFNTDQNSSIAVLDMTKVRDDRQGDGLMTLFFAAAIPVLQNAGISQIHLNATNVMPWAKLGFLPSNQGEYDRFSGDLSEYWARLAPQTILSEAQKRGITKDLQHLDAEAFKRLAGLPDCIERDGSEYKICNLLFDRGTIKMKFEMSDERMVQAVLDKAEEKKAAYQAPVYEA